MAPDGWGIYLATDDAEKTVAAAVANGGEVIVPAMDVMDLGRMAIVADVGHAGIGAWQPGLHRGFGLLAEPGAPSWFELHTRDYDASVRFYQDVFKWETSVASDEPDFRYTTLGSGDDSSRASWTPARSCPRACPRPGRSTSASKTPMPALAKVVELGGTIVTPAEDTPYGRLAQAADPTGAQFKLVAG